MTTLTRNKIEIPEAPAIPGLTFRNYAGEADSPHVMKIFNACKDVDGVEYHMTLEDIAHNFNHLERSDPCTDMIFAEVNGEAIAYSRVGWYQESEGNYLYYALGWIDPSWRRKGIGTAILKHNERRLREIAADHPVEAPKFFQNDHNNKQVGVEALLKANGYEPIRWGYEMTRPVEAPIPESPLPEGVEVRPVTEEHYRAIHEASNEAFRDHWGYAESTEEDYQRWLAWPLFNPQYWKVAWDVDEVAGMVLNFFNAQENEEYGRQRGWTDPICVRRPWRRRGLAKALIAQSIAMFREMDFDETALGVDTMNPNGAMNLYQSMGYEVVREGITYRKPME